MKEPPDPGPLTYTVEKGADCDFVEIIVGAVLALALIGALLFVLL